MATRAVGRRHVEQLGEHARCRRSISSSSRSICMPHEVMRREHAARLGDQSFGDWPISTIVARRPIRDGRVGEAAPRRPGDVAGEVAHPLEVAAHLQGGHDDRAGRWRPAAGGRSGRSRGGRARRAAVDGSSARSPLGERRSASSKAVEAPAIATPTSGSSRPAARRGRRAPPGTRRAWVILPSGTAPKASQGRVNDVPRQGEQS